ncbi:Ig-like domain-containing protein [Erwiniaceae bacterium L1_54_6]|nr:Ig-like domain-containing protein [Erwiniaceae bacterium L1_54_6]
MTYSSSTDDLLHRATNINGSENNVIIKVEPLTQLTIQSPPHGQIALKAGADIASIKSLRFVRHGNDLEIFTGHGKHPVVLIEDYYAQETPPDIYGIDDQGHRYSWSSTGETSLVSALTEGESSTGQAIPVAEGDSAPVAQVTDGAAAAGQQDDNDDKGAAGLFGMSGGWAAAAAGLATAAIAGGVIAASHHGGGSDDHSGSDSNARPPNPAYDIAIFDKDGNRITGDTTNIATPVIQGKAEPGMTVTIKDGDNVIGSAVVDGNGDWQITPDVPLAEGDSNLQVDVTNPGGNSTTSDITLNVDTTPPPGTLSDLQLINDNDPANPVAITDGITNDATPTITGTVADAEAGDRVVIKDGDKVLGYADIDANGHWTYTPDHDLGEGQHQLTAELQDAAGNSGASQQVDLQVDTTPPDAAQNITVDDRDGNANSGTNTNDSTPAIHGQAEPGSTVTIKDGDTVIGSAVVDGNGDWQITPNAPLGEGGNELVVEVTDPAGNSAQSDLTITVDTTPPDSVSTIRIANDANETIDGSKPTNDSTPHISGHVDGAQPGDKVIVKDDGKVLGEAAIDENGDWQFTPQPALGDGDHKITATVTDAAGNQGTPSTRIDYTQDTQAPTSTSTLEITNDDGGIINGTNPTNDSTPHIGGHVAGAQAGDKVIIKDDGKVLGEAAIDANGDWTFIPDPALGDGEHKITATVADEAGNQGTPSYTVEYNQNTQPEEGTSTLMITDDHQKVIDQNHPTNDSTPNFSGHVTGAKPGDKVIIKDGKDQLGEVAVDAEGNWTFTPDNGLGEGPHHITVTVTDSAGNIGATTGPVDYTQDTVPPAPATDIVITNDQTHEVILANGVTNDKSPTLTGKAEAGSTVNILDKDGNVLISVKADDQGAWRTEVPDLADGLYDHMQVQVVDAAGNHSETGVPIFTVDTANHNTTTIVTDSEKTDATPTFSGQVTLKDNDTYDKVTVTIKDDQGKIIASDVKVNPDGSWSYTPDDQHPLDTGPHHISAVVVDQATNESEPGYLNGSADGSWTVLPAEPVVLFSDAGKGTGDNFGYAITTSDDFIYISAPRGGLNQAGSENYQGVIYAVAKQYAWMITESTSMEALFKAHPEIGTIITNNSAVANANGDGSDLMGYGIKALDNGWVAIYSHWNDKAFFVKEPLPNNFDLKEISNAEGGHSPYGFMMTDTDWGKYFGFNVGSVANADGTLTFLISDISAPRGQQGVITTVTFDPEHGKWGNIKLQPDPTNGTPHAPWVPITTPDGMVVGNIDYEDYTNAAGSTQNYNFGSDIQMLGDIFGNQQQYLAIQDAESAVKNGAGRGTWYLYKVPEDGLPKSFSVADATADPTQLIRIHNIGEGLLNEINARPIADGGGAEQIPHNHNIANLGGFSNGTDTDIAIGSSTDYSGSSNGKVWVLHANKIKGDINIGVNETVKDFDTQYGYGIVSTNHPGSKQGFGLNVIGGYDFNGDGINDLIISDPLAVNNNKVVGAVYVVYGGHEKDYEDALKANHGQIDIKTILENGWGEVHYGSVENQYFGWSVDVVDMNKDGHPDLIVGAPSQIGAATTDKNPNAQYNGQVYVIYNTHDAPVADDTTPAARAFNVDEPTHHDDSGIALLLDGDHQNIDLANLVDALKEVHNIDMSNGNNTLKVDNQTLDKVEGENHDALFVNGENGNVELSGGADHWQDNGTVTIDGKVYHDYHSSGQSEVLIEDRIHVTIL